MGLAGSQDHISFPLLVQASKSNSTRSNWISIQVCPPSIPSPPSFSLFHASSLCSSQVHSEEPYHHHQLMQVCMVGVGILPHSPCFFPSTGFQHHQHPALTRWKPKRMNGVPPSLAFSSSALSQVEANKCRRRTTASRCKQDSNKRRSTCVSGRS